MGQNLPKRVLAAGLLAIAANSGGCTFAPQELMFRERSMYQASAHVAFYSEDSQITNRFFAQRAMLTLGRFCD